MDWKTVSAEQIKDLIKEGENIKDWDDDGNTPLVEQLTIKLKEFKFQSGGNP